MKTFAVVLNVLLLVVCILALFGLLIGRPEGGYSAPIFAICWALGLCLLIASCSIVNLIYISRVAANPKEPVKKERIRELKKDEQKE